jgi:uncharacterized protein (DUF2147 family)
MQQTTMTTISAGVRRSRLRGLIRRMGGTACGLLLLIGVAEPGSTARADQPSTPSPLGFWSLEHNQGVVEIYTCGWQTLCGALVGIEFDRPTDPMPTTWDHRSQCDFPFISRLRPRGDAWVGTITNPKSGHTYDARVFLAGPGVLKLRGYFLIPTLGETQTWTRFDGTPPADCRMTPSDFSGPVDQ